MPPAVWLKCTAGLKGASRCTSLGFKETQDAQMVHLCPQMGFKIDILAVLRCAPRCALLVLSTKIKTTLTLLPLLLLLQLLLLLLDRSTPMPSSKPQSHFGLSLLNMLKTQLTGFKIGH